MAEAAATAAVPQDRAARCCRAASAHRTLHQAVCRQPGAKQGGQPRLKAPLARCDGSGAHLLASAAVRWVAELSALRSRLTQASGERERGRQALTRLLATCNSWEGECQVQPRVPRRLKGSHATGQQAQQASATQESGVRCSLL